MNPQTKPIPSTAREMTLAAAFRAVLDAAKHGVAFSKEHLSKLSRSSVMELISSHDADNPDQRESTADEVVLAAALKDMVNASDNGSPYAWKDLAGTSFQDARDAAARHANPAGPRKLLEVPVVAVETLLIGDQVDLKTCPHLKGNPAAEFEFGVVESVQREMRDCIVVSYENFNPVGYRVGTMLGVSHETFAGRNSIDWYERRHELEPGMAFKTVLGGIVKLDRRVPGDGTQWYVVDRFRGSWCYQDGVIEPGDLIGGPLSDDKLD